MSLAARRRALAVLAALPTLSLAAGAQAPARAPLRLTVVNLMPWAGFDPQGRPTGVLVDLAALLAASGGVALKPLLVPYGRAPHMLNSGGADLMLSTDSQVTGGTAIEHLGEIAIMLFGRAGFRFQHLRDLHGKTVGYLRHSAYSPALEAEARIHRHAFDSYEQGVRMLRAGRLDAIMGTSDSIAYALRKQRAGDAVSPRYPLARVKLTLFAGRHVDAGVAAALQAACRQLRQQQTMETLLRRYASVSDGETA